jgi:hypothetical protein
MVHFDPAAIEAAGTVALAAETGAAMLGKGKKRVPAPAAPTPVNATINGITGQDLLIAVAILALAIIAAALIIHHGLVA